MERSVVGWEAHSLDPWPRQAFTAAISIDGHPWHVSWL